MLEDGYQVVITVRTHEKGRLILSHCTDPKRRQHLSYVIVTDIAEDGAFDHVFLDSDSSSSSESHPFDYVIHTASPYHFDISDPVKQFLDPAIKGTTGILQSIKQHAPTVKRVVITSSTATILNPPNHPKVYDESVWGSATLEDGIKDKSKTYRVSKIYAERAALDFVNQHQDEINFDLAIINPPLVFGPVPRHLADLSDGQLNTSNHRIRDMLEGKFSRQVPPTGPVCIFADVRDVARAHVNALTAAPGLGGKGSERFMVVGGYFSHKRIADVFRARFPELAPSMLPPAGEVVDDFPAEVFGVDVGKANRVLGMDQYRGLDECIADTVESMLRVNKTRS